MNPLKIGPLKIWPPVVLAPMAGITNAPFRTICRQFGAGLFISEMIAARLLVQREKSTLKLASFAIDEKPRSIQLYGTDPTYLGEAVKILVGENSVDHIDLNFGCPVRKITRKGGGAAIPLKLNLFRKLIAAAVENAEHIPVTIKFRLGINHQYQTYLEAGKISEEEGCAAISLHARTAAQLYDGKANWETISKLKKTIKTIPVLGNGDIWKAEDAVRMMHQTGCDGVVIGRGCLGRPWIFRDIMDLFEGRNLKSGLNFGDVAQIMKDHARLLCSWMGEGNAILSFRKHSIWYLKGFPQLNNLKGKLLRVETLNQLEQIIAEVDPFLKYLPEENHIFHKKANTSQKVALPEGYLDNLDDDKPPCLQAEEMVSGG